LADLLRWATEGSVTTDSVGISSNFSLDFSVVKILETAVAVTDVSFFLITEVEKLDSVDLSRVSMSLKARSTCSDVPNSSLKILSDSLKFLEA